MPGQLPPKRPPRLDVERPVDRLVGDAHHLIVGVGKPQPARDLLGGVVIREAPFDHPAKLGTELELRRPRPPQAAPGLAVTGVGAVAPPTAAAVDLTGDRRVGAAKRPSDGAGRVPAGDPARDLLALFEGEAALGASAGPGPDPSRSRQVVADGPPGKAEPPADLAIAQPLRSQLPDPVPHRLAQAVAPWHHRTSFVGQQVADSLGWCGGDLNPPVLPALSLATASATDQSPAAIGLWSERSRALFICRHPTRLALTD